MRSLGKPVFAYSNVTASYHERITKYYSGQITSMPNGELRGSDGLLLEDFEMNDNLMLDGAVAASGGTWVTSKAPQSELYSDTQAFETIIEIAANELLDSKPK